MGRVGQSEIRARQSAAEIKHGILFFISFGTTADRPLSGPLRFSPDKLFVFGKTQGSTDAPAPFRGQ